MTATIDSLFISINQFVAYGNIDNSGIQNSLVKKLYCVRDAKLIPAINKLETFIDDVQVQSGKCIMTDAVNPLFTNVQ